MGISIVMFQHDAVTEFTMMCFSWFCTLHSLRYHCECSGDTDMHCSLFLCVCVCVYVIGDMRLSGKTPCDIQDTIWLHAHASVHIQCFWKEKDSLMFVLSYNLLNSCSMLLISDSVNLF
jgi:hypothetical protein